MDLGGYFQRRDTVIVITNGGAVPPGRGVLIGRPLGGIALGRRNVRIISLCKVILYALLPQVVVGEDDVAVGVLRPDTVAQGVIASRIICILILLVFGSFDINRITRIRK